MASSTAQHVALARAHLTYLGIVDDPFAVMMLRLPWRVIGRALRVPLLRDFGSASLAYLAARTLCFDDAVKTAMDDGIRQVLIVGAGYDSRAWRLCRDGVEFIEIDHPDTQADKKRRAPPGGPRYVPVDLAQDTIPASLVERPAISTVEGVTMYLAEDHARRFCVGQASNRMGKTAMAKTGPLLVRRALGSSTASIGARTMSSVRRPATRLDGCRRCLRGARAQSAFAPTRRSR